MPPNTPQDETPLHRCANCKRNTVNGTWCKHGHRYRYGRVQIKCDGFTPLPLDHAFGLDNTEGVKGLVVLTPGGPVPLLRWTSRNSRGATVRMFQDWLEEAMSGYYKTAYREALQRRPPSAETATEKET